MPTSSVTYASIVPVQFNSSHKRNILSYWPTQGKRQVEAVQAELETTRAVLRRQVLHSGEGEGGTRRC